VMLDETHQEMHMGPRLSKMDFLVPTSLTKSELSSSVPISHISRASRAPDEIQNLPVKRQTIDHEP
jgi:hypothetical protein